MKKYIIVWIDGTVQSSDDKLLLQEFWNNNNIVAIINTQDKTYLSYVEEEEMWFPIENKS